MKCSLTNEITTTYLANKGHCWRRKNKLVSEVFFFYEPSNRKRRATIVIDLRNSGTGRLQNFMQPQHKNWKKQEIVRTRQKVFQLQLTHAQV